MNSILDYYQRIKDGSITVGKWILLWYEMIVHGIEDGTYTFSAKKANKAVKYIESYCRHHEGELGGKLLKLELWQKAFISVVFGILDKDGARQFREIVLIVARKNGKTLFAAAVASYCAFLDGEYGARIYFAAPKLEQAGLCYSAFYQMINMDDELSAMAKKRRTDIYIESSNTTAKPIAFSAKKSDGLNVSLCVADEIASWGGDAGLKFYEVIKSSFGARKQPLLVSITTAGYENEGIYDELIKRSTRLLLGESKETRLAPFIYQIDDPLKWNDINELYKSNPNLGVSVSVDYMLEEIAIAEGSLSKKAEFLTKYCNIKQNSSQAWLSTEILRKGTQQNFDISQFKGSYAVGGIDLSRTTDLTACTLIVERQGILYVFAKFFLPGEKIEEATARDGLPYNAYVKRGILQLSGDNFVNYRDCYDWFVEMVRDYEIYPLKIGYDRYSAQYLINDLQTSGFHCDDVFQGYNLTPIIREFEGLAKSGQIQIGDNDLLKIHLLNAALKIDNDTERSKLVKLTATGHIDGAAALLDAMTVRQKYWNEIGGRLKNEG